MNEKSAAAKLVGLAIAVLIVILAYGFLTMPDHRSMGDKVHDAVHDLDKGPDKAVRQLESRTPGEKLGDAIKDTGDDIKRNTREP